VDIEQDLSYIFTNFIQIYVYPMVFFAEKLPAQRRCYRTFSTIIWHKWTQWSTHRKLIPTASTPTLIIFSNIYLTFAPHSCDRWYFPRVHIYFVDSNHIQLQLLCTQNIMNHKRNSDMIMPIIIINTIRSRLQWCLIDEMGI
jgi:hypothetical protein